MRGRIARPAFTHLPAAKLSLLSWLDFYVSGFGGNMLAMIRYRHGKKE
jgi:hypothetical protein